MTSLRRVPMLARVAARYAARHRGQTIRAVLGLLVVTTVLTVGLGLGESIAGSLEREALAQYGPIDVRLRGAEPFEAAVVDRVMGNASVRALGVAGAPTLAVTGTVVHPGNDLAEALASIRGVSPREATALGPFTSVDGAPVPEPGRGEVVLSEDLARRLEARVGDRVELRAQPPGAWPDADLDRVNFTGVTNAPPPLGGPHDVVVREGAIGVGAVALWVPGSASGPVTVTATSPTGVTFANESADPPALLFVESPEAGTWSFSVTSSGLVPYNGTAGAAYAPADLLGGAVTMEATVVGIAEAEGRAAITRRPVALVPLADLQDALGARGLATEAYFRVTGDPYEAARGIGDAAAANLSSEAVKAEALAEAAEAGREVAGFLIGMGGFTVLAALLLAFTLFSALVEERRSELGIARALGLTRGEVAFSMTLEGALYALVAALVGLVLGVALLVGLITVISTAAAAEEGAPDFDLFLSPGTLAASFAFGVLVPLLTIALASLRFARLDPARAIRGIPEDAKSQRSGLLVLALGLLVAGGLLSTTAVGALVGVPVLAAGVATGLAARGLRWPALAFAAAGVAHAAWSLYSFTAFPEEVEELDPITTLARGAVLALGFAALAVASPAPYLWVSRLFSGGERPGRASFVSLKYLVSRRLAAGLTMGMIALVVVIVTVMGTLFALFSGQIPTHEAGYDVVGESALLLDAWPGALPADLEASIERADFLPRHAELRRANLTKDGEPVGPPWGLGQFVGVTPAFAEGNEYELAARADRYADDRAAWDAVAAGEGLMLPDWMADEYGPAMGDEIVLQRQNGDRIPLVVAGAVRTSFMSGSFVAADVVRDMGFPQSTTVVVRVAEGADPGSVARRLNAEFAASGMTFLSVPEEAARIAAAVNASILVFESFLALGLFVGLASTGFLAARAVHERRRDIGTLRALGFEESDVRRAFVIESTATAGIGFLIGTAVGLLVAHSIWWREIRSSGFEFRPPFLVLALFAAAILGLAAYAARGPAKRAARLPPALAVRHVE